MVGGKVRLTRRTRIDCILIRKPAERVEDMPGDHASGFSFPDAIPENPFCHVADVLGFYPDGDLALICGWSGKVELDLAPFRPCYYMLSTMVS